MKKYYIVYELVVDANKNVVDFQNKYDTSSRADLANWLDISINNIANYTCKDLDNINCRLKDNKYFIFKDFE